MKFHTINHSHYHNLVPLTKRVVKSLNYIMLSHKMERVSLRKRKRNEGFRGAWVYLTDTGQSLVYKDKVVP